MNKSENQIKEDSISKIEKFKQYFKQRIPNGDVLFIRTRMKYPNLSRLYTPDREMFFKEMTKFLYDSELELCLKQLDINLIHCNFVKDKHIVENGNGLTFLSDFANLLYSGGHYAIQLDSSYETFELTLDFMYSYFGKHLAGFDVYKVYGRWNSWFKADFEDLITYIILDVKSNEIDLVLIQDTD